MGIACSGQPHHLESVLRLDHFFCYLMRWDGGGDEDDLLEPECLPNLFCAPKVTQMDGIEGTPKKPNSLTCGLPFNLSALPDKKSEIKNKDVKF
jgi:hypothetical protein